MDLRQFILNAVINDIGVILHIRLRISRRCRRYKGCFVHYGNPRLIIFQHVVHRRIIIIGAGRMPRARPVRISG